MGATQVMNLVGTVLTISKNLNFLKFSTLLACSLLLFDIICWGLHGPHVHGLHGAVRNN